MILPDATPSRRDRPTPGRRRSAGAGARPGAWASSGPGPVDAHLDHAARLRRRAGRRRRRRRPGAGLDLGSGGGVPGLVAGRCAGPAVAWVLLDAGERRAAFLAEAVARPGAGGPGRGASRAGPRWWAATPRYRGAFDLVVARGFGPPAVTAECAAPLLRSVGGCSS